MTNHHRTKSSPEVPGENPREKEGMKDVPARHPEKETKLSEEKRVERREQQQFADFYEEGDRIFEERKEDCFALSQEVKDRVVEPHMRTEEVAKQSALALREQATKKGMPLKELAFETLRKVNYLQA